MERSHYEPGKRLCDCLFTLRRTKQPFLISFYEFSGAEGGERYDFEPTYDDAGNQTLVKTSTGIWSVACNAENRPVRFTRTEADGTKTRISCAYDYMGRRATKLVETVSAAEDGTETATAVLHQRYIYRGYLQIAACDLAAEGTPCLWNILWDPTQPVAARPLAIRMGGTWHAYGWDLTKNVCELFDSSGAIAASYSYTPYGEATASGAVAQIPRGHGGGDGQTGRVCPAGASRRWGGREALRNRQDIQEEMLRMQFIMYE